MFARQESHMRIIITVSLINRQGFSQDSLPYDNVVRVSHFPKALAMDGANHSAPLAP